MTADEISRILADYFWPRTPPARTPSASEWRALGTALGWSWPDDFFTFHQVVVGFSFEGDLLAVADSDGEDTIALSLKLEREIGGWPEDLIPFEAVGNGDYFCLSIREGSGSGVYYVRHEDRGVERLHDSFGDWLRQLGTYHRSRGSPGPEE